MEYPSIFSPLTVKSMTVKNRIAMLPMGSNMGGEFGNITDDHIRYYEQRAKGGTGLIIVENACVYKQGLNGTTQIRIDKDRYIPGFSRLVERIHSYGACASLQINHAGAGAIPERTGMENLERFLRAQQGRRSHPSADDQGRDHARRQMLRRRGGTRGRGRL